LRLTKALAAVGVALGVAACGSSNVSRGEQLVKRIIPPPQGFTYYPSAGATGSISPAVFSQFGGEGSASKVQFLAGFRQNYANDQTLEGLTISVLEFSSTAAASSYFADTAHEALSYSAPKYRPYPAINGAVEVDGTKPYAGEYIHGVVMTRDRFCAIVVYVADGPGSPPIELSEWSRVQYELL